MVRMTVGITRLPLHPVTSQATPRHRESWSNLYFITTKHSDRSQEIFSHILAFIQAWCLIISYDPHLQLHLHWKMLSLQLLE